ncbi:HIRAN domain-containing protein [Nocardioides sp. MAHUQ-72]|uniref:HIRAN domain-containing protein n=1 Tax=unclassified Nocardioides TaxID=2615069 RepID=UPI003610F33D
MNETRLLVCWQEPVTRSYHAVAVLTCSQGEFLFAYLDQAKELAGFRPLLGFSDLDSVYRAPGLFPLFSERVLDPSRPDRPTMLDALALGEEAGPLEFLARSGGRRGGDTLEVLPIPFVGAAGETNCTFLVHGVRYQAGAEDALSRLSAGDELCLVREPANPKDPKALLVARDETPLGWVPNPLLGYAHAVLSVGDPSVRVVRVNGPEFGHHMRLLVELTGTLPTDYAAPWDSCLARLAVDR